MKKMNKRTLTSNQPLPVAKKPRRSVQALMLPPDEEVGSLAQRKKMTRLEMRSVSSECRSQYDLYLDKFKAFCSENGHSWPPGVGLADELMADFMDIQFLENKPAHEGEKTLAALEYNQIHLKGTMLRSRRALRGWRKAMPATSRLPLPRLAMYGIAMQLIYEGLLDMSLMVLVAFFLYLRPGEAHDLQGKHVIPPVRAAGRQFSWVNVVIRDAEGMKPDKVGVFDNSLPLDVKPIQWIGLALLDRKKALPKQTDKLFRFSMEEFRKKFQAAAQEINLEGIHPYQLRHGGATEDLTSKIREFSMVKARGRWKTDASVRRYAKTGRVQQLLCRLSLRNMQFCTWSEKNIQAVYQGRLLPRSAAL